MLKLNCKKMMCIGLFVVLVSSGICTKPVFSADADGAKSLKKARAAAAASSRVTRSREEMILEVEMKALREALDSRNDQEGSSKFADKADKELEAAKESAGKSREMLTTATAAQAEVSAAKTAALSAVDKAKTAADEAVSLAENTKKESKLSEVEGAAYKELSLLAKKEVLEAGTREVSAEALMNQAREKEIYYRELVKRRYRNAEDFYYIASAAMKKGGNSQALEFAVKAKSEMEQAKIAEGEAAIRAEATKAAEKVVETRKATTEAAKIKAVAMVKILKISDETSKALKEAYVAANLSAQAAQKLMERNKEFAAAKDELLAFSNKKVESLTEIKDSAEKKETLAAEAAEAARAVLAAKQKAEAEAEARAQGALAEARNLVIGPQQDVSGAGQPGATRAVPQAPAAPVTAPAAAPIAK